MIGGRWGVLAGLLALPLLAAAQAYPPELPPIDRARIALDDSPDVRAAAALREAGLAERRQLIAGPHEWSARADYQRRRATEVSPVERFNEWAVALERPLRRPEKSALDRRIGDQRVAEASVALADARHEAARRLLALWYAWLREQAAANVLRNQVDLATREVAAVARRQQLGDASRLDELQARAAVAQAEAAARQARERVQRAQLTLQEEFPQISPPGEGHLPDPALPAGELAALGETALREDHGLLLARAAAQRGRLESERAIAERRPDPTVGVQYGSERAGADRIIGVFVSIPFAGEARRASADAGIAKASALEQLAEARRRQSSGQVRSLQSAVSSGLLRWQAAENGAELQAGVAERVAAANQLGETGFAEVLRTRRLALEAALLATTARVDALENRARLLLDAHRLWDFDSHVDSDVN